MKTMYHIDHSTKTVTISPKFMKAAGKLGNPEYELMLQIRKENPDYRIECKQNKKATKKNSYRNLTVPNMEIFIQNSQDDTRDVKVRLEEFKSVKELAKSQASQYAYIKAWFLKKYGKEYNKYAQEECDLEGNQFPESNRTEESTKKAADKP